MSSTGLAQIDHAVQQANVWLGELMMQLDWTEREQAYRALRTVLPLVRNHLPANEAADLAAQLPLLLRALYFEGWHPAGEPMKDRKGDKFISQIGRVFGHQAGVGPAEIAGAVFALLSNHVSPGEIGQVKSALPEGLRRYWSDQTKLSRAAL